MHLIIMASAIIEYEVTFIGAITFCYCFSLSYEDIDDCLLNSDAINYYRSYEFLEFVKGKKSPTPLVLYTL